MDLGATLCTRSKPRCEQCPMENQCLANELGQQTQFPHRKPKVQRPVKSIIMLVIRDEAGRILLLKRPPTGIWGGLWSFPELAPSQTNIEDWCLNHLSIKVKVAQDLANVRHGFQSLRARISDP